MQHQKGGVCIGDMRGERREETYLFNSFSVLLETIIVTIKISIFCFKWGSTVETCFASMAGQSICNLFQFLIIIRTIPNHNLPQNPMQHQKGGVHLETSLGEYWVKVTFLLFFGLLIGLLIGLRILSFQSLQLLQYA